MDDDPNLGDGLPTSPTGASAAADTEEAPEPRSEPSSSGPPLGLQIHADSSSPDYDVIAVHGIHGDMATWGIDESNLEVTDDCWLPLRFENARIMTFNYDTDPEKTRYYTRLGVEEEAKKLLASIEQHRQGAEDRPIVFVTHDLGGLIVKAALASIRRPQADFHTGVHMAVEALVRRVILILASSPGRMLIFLFSP
jgi:hypothetical protein